MVRENNSKNTRKGSFLPVDLLDQRGSALVLVMFVVLLLTILGLGVLSAAIGGAQRTETRENDVQSLHLAQKGLNEAAAYIQTALDDEINIDPDNMSQVIDDLISDLMLKINENEDGVITDINGAKAKIESITYVKQDKQKYYITICASANVNGVNRELQQKIVIDTYPDFLKYAFGSEANLILNGAPVIHGNIYAGKELIISDKAEYTYKGYNMPPKETQFPKMKTDDSRAAEMILPEVHVQSLGSIKYSGGGAINSSITSQNASIILPRVLGISPQQVFIKPSSKFVRINVEETFIDKVEEALNRSSRADIKAAIHSKTLGSYTRGILTSLPSGTPPLPSALPENPTAAQKTAYQNYLDDLVAYKEQQNQLLTERTESAVYMGDLIIDGIDNKQLTFTLSSKTGSKQTNPEIKPKWLIVDGDLLIDNYNTDVFLSIQANLLVTGNVKIKGKVAFNSTLYSIGQTTVEDAVIKGLDNNELVLISKGPVLINRIDAFNDQLNEEMKAFFYTDQTADLYGVGSLFWLNGGFFSKGNLTVNAVLGEVNPPQAEANPLTPFMFDNQQQSDLIERFRIKYNQQVFIHQQSSLPRVRGVNVTSGPLELVKP